MFWDSSDGESNCKRLLEGNHKASNIVQVGRFNLNIFLNQGILDYINIPPRKTGGLFCQTVFIRATLIRAVIMST